MTSESCKRCIIALDIAILQILFPGLPFFSNQESIRNSGPKNSALAFPGAPKPIESNKAWRIGGFGGSGPARAKVSQVALK